ncbi:hypothetical protein COCSUDRAFT_54526 [Coccomyxa subellipsoidea C-169]|uniref:Uncharacterized protein n=1 Tax=Coccomyxa subellipsoidea (strain C-169) TaxID=574566 RepID=I0YNR4_COCSC|nr:hypothetical protein COCSUDRAFT_54526 [Coccomyxa subellipsoidea C-169]EIE20033.1 hypothetical protein COCSUDRAFT_54526 [Coccomyxa subellipsoidea C-169]|eukprot:XP_005644577.1 hypothetical protein COCSUDRAFT_54526 [Coccomyxa subellipsoidea C-169]
MMIPSSLGTSLKQSENGTMTRVPGSPWVRPSWPLAGTSIGRQTPHFGMGTSPFGKSVDMVDVCKQLMDGHGADTFNMGSLRNELNMHTHFPSTGSIEEEEDEDEDIMLMGTTPQQATMQPRPLNPVPRFETTPVPAFRQHTWTSGQMIAHN